jgi:hypothetical protein
MDNIEKFWIIKKEPVEHECRKVKTVASQGNAVYTDLGAAVKRCKQLAAKTQEVFVVLEAITAFGPVESVKEIQVGNCSKATFKSVID